jgi:signal recognition particle subunit SRP72
MVAQSLASLLQRASIDDHEEVLQSCNAVLAKSKSDLQAQHMKVVALLKLDRYDEALRTFEAGGDALKKSAGLEYAYASYKCGKLEQATEAVTRTASGRGADHLEAQVVRCPIQCYSSTNANIPLQR